MNVFSFTGNLGKDAEVRVTTTGKSVCSFSVAVKSGFGDKASTTWVRCTLWGKRGESLAPYLIKGQQVVVSGEAKLSEWTNRDGENKANLECRVNDVTLVGGKQVGESQPRPAKQAVKQPEIPDFDDEDLPF